MTLIPVILSGGTGARLWPVSRQACPKPFMKIGTSTLLQQAVERGQACGTDNAFIVTNQDYLFMSRDVVGGLADPPNAHYLLEPNGRNTAPAIALAAIACAHKHGLDAVMLILPADHLIPDMQAFVACALEAAQQARQGQLVVFGISPTSPDTAFGYIEVEKIGRNTQKALNFVEKPDAATARHYLSTGRYYWNSGMFCFTAEAILKAFEAHSPEVMRAAAHAWSDGTTEKDATRFEPHSFALQPDISIDYAVMEHADNVTMVPARFGWSDVGSWPAMAQAHPADSSGNTLIHGPGNVVVALDTKDTHVLATGRAGRVVATVGVQDLVIVDTPDAVLVLHKNAAQQVKDVVEILKERRHDSVLLPAVVHRPWGTYTTLEEGSGYKVKRIAVKPGHALSLQYHRRRGEHWMVVQGVGTVQIGDHQYRTLPGQYRHIPVNETHRLTNSGPDELVLIEVQYGDYLHEDDIVRLADFYGRV